MNVPSTQLKVVHRAELTKVGNRSVSAVGYRNDLLEDHLRWHLTQMSNKWCSVDCLARTMFGRSSATNRMAVRKRVRSSFNALLKRGGIFLVVEYDDTQNGRGKIKAVKLFEAESGGIEGQYALHQIERMARRERMSAEMKALALAAIGATE